MTARARSPRSTTEAWVVRCVIASFLSVLACADPELPPQYLLYEGFETPCDDLPCGFVQTEGTSGQAVYASTSFHPGEHGLVLTGLGVTVRATRDDPARSITLTFGSLEARVVGRCDEGSFVDLTVGIAELADGSATGRVDQTTPAVLDLGTDWSTASTSVLTLTTARLDGGIGSGSFLTELRVTGITLAKRGTGTCEIGEIIIDQSSATEPMPGTRC